jgi:hypothetical protein
MQPYTRHDEKRQECFYIRMRLSTPPLPEAMVVSAKEPEYQSRVFRIERNTTSARSPMYDVTSPSILMSRIRWRIVVVRADRKISRACSAEGG